LNLGESSLNEDNNINIGEDNNINIDEDNNKVVKEDNNFDSQTHILILKLSITIIKLQDKMILILKYIWSKRGYWYEIERLISRKRPY